MKLIVQSLVLIVSFLAIYIWQQTILTAYTIPALGFLIFIYLFLSARKKGRAFLELGNSPWAIFALNTVIFLLIFSTEGLSSPIFFLLYFLGFGIAFVFEPMAIFVFVVGTVLIFLPDALKNDVTTNFLKVGSLVLISPLAYFFGNEFRRNDDQEAEIEALEERSQEAADTIAQDVKTVIEEEKENLSTKATDKLNDILEETEDLRQEKK
ncbi:hypothetical protein M1349_04065 [Patescibacteria group bacterium]|nr:hypothetical protein [Patescibacteria group bacterium]